MSFVEKIKSWPSIISHFLKEGLWIDDTAVGWKARCFAFCRIVLLVVKGFQRDACSLQASALSNITLISLVPMLAIMFSFSKAFGIQGHLLEKIGLERVAVVEEDGTKNWDYRLLGCGDNGECHILEAEGSSSEKVRNILDEDKNINLAKNLPVPAREALVKVFKYVENTNFTALGLVGTLMLIVGVIGSLSKLEVSFNGIWGIQNSRNFFRKSVEYFMMLIFVPVVFILATSMNSMLLSSKFIIYLQEHYGHIVILIHYTLRLAVVLIVLLGFSALYMFMPNTRVKLLPALVAGVLTGIMWFVVQWLYLYLQVGLVKFNSIYGTFAVVPFFLAWLYANWSIVLLGAEISFAVQNHNTLHIEKASQSAATGICIALANLLLFEVCKHFKEGKGGFSAQDFGLEKGVPSCVVQYVTELMLKSGLLLEIAGDGRNRRYVPGRVPQSISPADVEEAFIQNDTLDARRYLNALPKQLAKLCTESYDKYCADLRNLNFAQLE